MRTWPTMAFRLRGCSGLARSQYGLPADRRTRFRSGGAGSESAPGRDGVGRRAGSRRGRVYLHCSAGINRGPTAARRISSIARLLGARGARLSNLPTELQPILDGARAYEAALEPGARMRTYFCCEPCAVDFVGWLLDFTIQAGYIALRWGVAPGHCSGPRPSARFLGIRSGNATSGAGARPSLSKWKLQRRWSRPRLRYEPVSDQAEFACRELTTTASVSWTHR